MVLKTSENAIIGVNDHTLVTEDDSRRWVTRARSRLFPQALLVQCYCDDS